SSEQQTTYEIKDEGSSDPLPNNESQYANTWKFYLSEEHNLKQGWSLNYGATYTNSLTNIYQEEISIEDLIINSWRMSYDYRYRSPKQRVDSYVGLGKEWEKLSIHASLNNRYAQETWCHRWSWHPTVNATYTATPEHIFMLNLEGLKRGTTHWYNNDVWLGNNSWDYGKPQEGPSYQYDLWLSYLLKGSYLFSAWYRHDDGYYQRHILHYEEQDGDSYSLQQGEYSNRINQAGLQASLPVHVGRWLDTRLVLTGVWRHEQTTKEIANLYMASTFSQVCFYGMGRITNTFTLPSLPDLKLTLTGWIRSFMQQRGYDLPTTGSVDANLRYTFLQKRATFRVYADDLFGTSRRSLYRSDSRPKDDNNREFGASFTWRFKG
ncbi:MAG: outer membrane beta-barrel family protein, partial [Mediterranea sp.]|nr:outer membrane beta-barrel family protein [Mediterranea sp.]